MKNIVKISIVIICIMHSAAMSAQDFRDEAQDQMAKLGFMVGDWEGTGYALSPDGQKEISQVSESINYELDQTILNIRGIGQSDGETVHNALGILFYDVFSKSFKMNSWLAKGMSTTAQVEMVEMGKIKWWFEISPGRTIRYTINIEGDQWNEVGDMSTDGKTWHSFFEMNLNRVTK